MTKQELENIVTVIIHDYKSKHGKNGWYKTDIEKAVYDLGGNKNDVYAAMAIAMDICMGEKELGEHIIN